MTQPKETPAEKIKRLSEQVSGLTGLPLGLAGCGCPKNTLGQPPAIHICKECGFEGSERLHENCPGCYINLREINDKLKDKSPPKEKILIYQVQTDTIYDVYKNPKNEISDRFYPR